MDDQRQHAEEGVAHGDDADRAAEGADRGGEEEGLFHHRPPRLSLTAARLGACMDATAPSESEKPCRPM